MSGQDDVQRADVEDCRTAPTTSWTAQQGGRRGRPGWSGARRLV